MLARILFFILLITGIGLSAYLLDRHFTLAYPVGLEEESLCSGLGGNCDAALESGLAEELGIPLAGWGLVYYGTLASVMLLGLAMGASLRPETHAAAFLLTLLAALGSIALVTLMFRGDVPYCPVCLGVHAVNFALVPVMKRLSQQSLGELTGRLRAGAVYLVGRRAGFAPGARWKFVGFFFPLLMSIVLWQWVALQEHRRKDVSDAVFDPATVLAKYAAAPRQEISIGPETPTLGPDDAPARVVVYSDLECKSCHRFARVLEKCRERYGEKVQIAFKHFPLAQECNPHAKATGHQQACLKARAAIAAQKHGKFWTLHDELLRLPAFQPVSFTGIANFLKINVKTFVDDANSTDEKLKDDIDEAARLGVARTPTVFINGRRASSRPQGFELALAYELQRAAAANEKPSEDSQKAEPAS